MRLFSLPFPDSSVAEHSGQEPQCCSCPGPAIQWCPGSELPAVPAVSVVVPAGVFVQGRVVFPSGVGVYLF